MIVYGDQNFQCPEDITFGLYMLNQMRLKPANNVALENAITKEKITNKELIRYAVNLSASLTELGVKKGDVVAIGSELFLHYVPTTFAVTTIGAICTYYEIEIGQDTLKHKLQLAKPKYFICSSQFWQAYQDVLKSYNSIETYIAVSEFPDMFYEYSLETLTAEDIDVESFKPITVEGKADTAFIFYSSGTTGIPKGVELTHYNCIARCSLGISQDNIRSQVTLTRSLFLIPLRGEFCLFGTCRDLQMGGTALLTTDITSIDTVLYIIEKSKVQKMRASPLLIRDLITSATRKDHLDSLHTLICAGYPIRADTTQMFRDRLPHVENVFQAYGANECGVMATETIFLPTHKLSSVGVVLPGIVIKVVDLVTRDLLGPNENGEICVKGPTLMKGYINVDRSSYLDEDGFFKTGDIGYFDDDQYFYIVDRIKDIIFNKFDKVSPVDVENVLLQHPAVADVGVVGKTDPIFYEVAAAFVVKKPGCDVTETELIDFVDAKVQVSPAMQLKGGVRFISEIPRNDVGKTLRRQLKAILEETA